MKKGIKYLGLTLLIWFVGHSIYIITDGLTDEGLQADVAVILGSTVNEDGTLSPRLEARLKQGFVLYQTEKAKMLMVSGGLGKEGYSEGTVMAEYLVRWGVPPSDILIDNEGNNTYLTALHYQQAAAQHQFKSVIVVSQYFHISRTKMVFRKLGIENVTGSHARYFAWRDFYSVFREFFGWYGYWVRY